MFFLGWDSREKAADSLASVNAVYGCPYVAENGYRMDRWADIRKIYLEETYGFSSPESRLGRKMDDLMKDVVPGYQERTYNAGDFFAPEEE